MTNPASCPVHELLCLRIGFQRTGSSALTSNRRDCCRYCCRHCYMYFVDTLARHYYLSVIDGVVTLGDSQRRRYITCRIATSNAVYVITPVGRWLTGRSRPTDGTWRETAMGSCRQDRPPTVDDVIHRRRTSSRLCPCGRANLILVTCLMEKYQQDATWRHQQVVSDADSTDRRVA